jgi:hypothetical protein
VICIQSASIISFWARTTDAVPTPRLCALDKAGPERTAYSSVVRGSSNGAVAQLGERLICIQEVAGSIPTSSTKFGPVAQLARAHP